MPVATKNRFIDPSSAQIKKSRFLDPVDWAELNAARFEAIDGLPIADTEPVVVPSAAESIRPSLRGISGLESLPIDRTIQKPQPVASDIAQFAGLERDLPEVKKTDIDVLPKIRQPELKMGLPTEGLPEAKPDKTGVYPTYPTLQFKEAPLAAPIRGLARNLPIAATNVVRALGVFAPPNLPLVGSEDFEQAANFWREQIMKIPVPEAPEEYRRAPKKLQEWIDPQRIWNAFWENAPVTAALGGAYVLNPVLGTALMGAVEGGAVAEEMQDYEKRTGKKIPELQRRAVPIAAGVINAALERTGIETILGRGALGKRVKRRLVKAIISAGTEGVTEGTQEVVSVLSAIGYDKEGAKGASDRIIQSVYAGLVTGGILGGVMPDTRKKEIKPPPSPITPTEEITGKITLPPEDVNLPPELREEVAVTPEPAPEITPREEIVAPEPTIPEIAEKPAEIKAPVTPAEAPEIVEPIPEPTVPEKVPPVPPIEPEEISGIKPEEVKPEIEVETIGKDKTVTVDIKPKKEITVTPKEQKKYLIDEIDKAIDVTEVEAPQYNYEKSKVEHGTVTIEVPNDGEFTILNTRESLEKFKEIAGKKFPGTKEKREKLPLFKKPSSKPTGKRIKGAPVEYYNPFKPRKEKVITSKEREGNFYVSGYYSDGHYAIRVSKKPSVKGTYKDITPEKFNNAAIKGHERAVPSELVAEYWPPGSEVDIIPVKAHIETEEGKHYVLNAHYVDAILTQYPKAKAYTSAEGDKTFFKMNDQVVGLVMHLEQPQGKEGTLEGMGEYTVQKYREMKGIIEPKVKPEAEKPVPPIAPTEIPTEEVPAEPVEPPPELPPTEITPEVEPKVEPEVIAPEEKPPTKLSEKSIKGLLSANLYPAGKQNAEFRQQVMLELTGNKPPKAKAGTTIIRDTLLEQAGITKEGKAPVEYERELTTWLEEQVKAPAEAPEAEVAPIPAEKEIVPPESPVEAEEGVKEEVAWKTGEARPFTYDPDSTENEGRFRLQDTAEFDEMGMVKSKFRSQSEQKGIKAEGVRFTVGTIKGKEEIQDIRFDNSKWTEEQASEWLSENAAKLERPDLAKIVIKEEIVPPTPPTPPVETEEDFGMREDLPKYAASVNLERQILQRQAKEIELKAAEAHPKKPVLWKETEEKAEKLMQDPEYMKKLSEKRMKDEGVSAAEIDAARNINANAVYDLYEKRDLPKEEFDKYFKEYSDNIFAVVSDASSEVGRALNIHKKYIAPNALGNIFAKMKRGLNEREMKEFRELDIDNPFEVKQFTDRLGNPKLRDYIYEFWYNSILSGIPTHLVNVMSNTGWSVFQVPHRALKGGIDATISKLTGRQRQIYMKEIVPLMAGYAKGFKPGAKAAWEVMKTGRAKNVETKWQMEIGHSLGAFERSPNKYARKMAPIASGFLRALQAMDVWAKSMGVDAELNAIARRKGLNQGLSGKELKDFEKRFLTEPDEKSMNDAKEFAKHVVFMDDPGKFTNWIISGRDIVPGSRFIVPFVNTISNLTQRGIEKTPGLGLGLEAYRKLSKQKTLSAEEVIANQIEGSVLGLYILSLVARGLITGAAPSGESEREAFYRQGKLPWAIKIGDKWYQYRRIEPFNTVIASVTIAHDAIKNAEDDETATEIFGNMVNGIVNNLVDSSYLQGVTNILDRYGRRRGMGQRMFASFVPFSSFWRSINRAYEVQTKGKTFVRDNKSLLGALSQVIPGMSGITKPRINVWGKEIEIPGGVFRQWLPYKLAEETTDPVEIEFERLGFYPGLPGRNITIRGKKIELPDDLYRDYSLSYGTRAKQEMTHIISLPVYQKKDDIRKLQILDRKMTIYRNVERKRVIAKYIKNKSLESKTNKEE